MKFSKQLTSLFVAAAVLAGGTPDLLSAQSLRTFSLSASAADIVASGECGAEGDNLT